MTEPAPLLSVRNVSKHFGGVQALRDVSLDLHPGEVLALAGDNGAGKSTLIKAISGVHHYDSGDIVFAGERVAFSSPLEARARGIETIYQDLALADNLSIGANIFLGREPKTKLFGFLPILDRKKMAEAAKETMALLDFHVERFRGAGLDIFGRPAAGRGDRAGDLLECPGAGHGRATAALGVPEQRKVISLIKSLKERGKGVIFISHNLQDIFAVADRIVVLRRGVKAGERQASETSGDEIVRLMVGA
jgi:simple sugar transport system ATP-binding protein